MSTGKTVILENTGFGSVVLRMSYDQYVIAKLKVDIPSTDREYNPTTKAWTLDGKWRDYIVTLLTTAGFTIMGDALHGVVGQRGIVRETIRVNYMGNARKRPDGSVTASGMDERGEWKYLFIFDALSDWFDLPAVTSSPLDAADLYGMFGIARDATGDEVKKAYRRLMRSWHPDVNSDPKAGEVFIALQDGYAVLSDAKRRGRYDVGLSLQPLMPPKAGSDIVWIPPDGSRCGYVDVEMETGLRTSVIRRIYGWDDIVNTRGQRMIAKWNSSRNEVEYSWL